MADINSIITEINTITTDIKDAFSPFLSVGRMILASGAIIWIIIDAMKVMATGERDGLSNHLQGWVKPLFISLLLLFYNPILSLCDFLVSPTYSATEGWAISYMQQNETIEKKYEKDLEQIYLTANSPTPSNEEEEDGVFARVSNEVNSIVMQLKIFIQKVELYTSSSYILGLLLMILSKIINFCLIVSYLGILVMQNINLAIIMAFGPISIGLSIFHPFGDNWKAFYSNYVSKLLWYPVANMSLAIAYRLKNISDQNAYDVLLKFAKATVEASKTVAGSVNNATGLTGIEVIQTMDWVPIFLSIGVTIVGCYAVINTPSLVGNIITGVSGGMSSSPVSGTMAAGAMGALAYKGLSAIKGVIPNPSDNDRPSSQNGNTSNKSPVEV
ncbi:hypothetical protein VB796_22920 [Arcicella sp. LKC2W]|jgi:hypothetical protein|uniref:hypothetical protein n=1 Tax=Arcicella sp. LKC2W TaxID=2984198 RepID=UPI002B220D32|nr:hypothetical protein [Arcicella sp. LKC2W]MEA5461941.1 hypothetical protein [Arcicella sp. LKC2W]